MKNHQVKIFQQSTNFQFLMLKVRLVTRLHSDGFFLAKMIINVFFAVDLHNVKWQIINHQLAPLDFLNKWKWKVKLACLIFSKYHHQNFRISETKNVCTLTEIKLQKPCWQVFDISISIISASCFWHVCCTRYAKKVQEFEKL